MKKRIFYVFITLLLLTGIYAQGARANWLLNGDGEIEFMGEGFVLGRDTEKTLPAQAQGKARGGDEDDSEEADVVEIQELSEVKTTGKPSWVLIKNENRKLNVSVLDENGEEVDVPESSESGEFEIEEPKDKNKIKVQATERSALVIRNKVAAKTNFPIMVNTETGELMINTPNKGVRTVTILPDQAIQNMLAANVLDVIGGKGALNYENYLAQQEPEPTDATGSGETDEATESGETEEGTESGSTPEPSASATPSGTPEPIPTEEVDTGIELTTNEEGDPVYEIEGVKNERVLGLLPVGLQRKVIVSAETGELLGIDQNWYTRVLDLISF